MILFLNKAAMSYVMPPQPTPKQQKYRKRLIRRLKKRGMFIKDANHKGAGTYGLLAPHGKMYIGKSGEVPQRSDAGVTRATAYNKKKRRQVERKQVSVPSNKEMGLGSVRKIPVPKA